MFYHEQKTFIFLCDWHFAASKILKDGHVYQNKNFLETKFAMFFGSAKQMYGLMQMGPYAQQEELNV